VYTRLPDTSPDAVVHLALVSVPVLVAAKPATATPSTTTKAVATTTLAWLRRPVERRGKGGGLQPWRLPIITFSS